MKLTTLLRRSGTDEELTTDHVTAAKSDNDPRALRREWDHRRQNADSAAERTEIDAFFSRAMP